jgi:streptogramin lyase
MDMDRQDRLWFAESRAGKIRMFDTKTNAFQEWPLSTPYAGPYDAKYDKNGNPQIRRQVRRWAKAGPSPGTPGSG